MNTQKNIIDFENARNVLNELKEYINNKKQKTNVSNEMQLAEQNVIETDKIEEKPLTAIDINNPIPSTEVSEPQIIESTEVTANPVLTTEISNQVTTYPTTMEPAIVNNQLEDNGVLNIASPAEPIASPAEPIASPVEPISSPAEPIASPVEPISSPAEPIASPVEPISSPVESIVNPTEPIVSSVEPVVQVPKNEPVTIVNQPQLGNAQGMEVLPQNVETNFINNDNPTILEPSSPIQNNDIPSPPLAPQLETNSINNGVMETQQDSTISANGTEQVSNSNGLEVVPQIDINTIMGETSNQEVVSANETEPEAYKAATNMGAVALNDNPSISTSGEVMIPTGQESVPQSSSPVVTEASFNESAETMKLAV